jgi:hypothetical protein
MEDSPAIAALRECLETVVAEQSTTVREVMASEVHRCVVDAVDELKRQGLPPERVVALVKGVATAVGLPTELEVQGESRLIEIAFIAERLVAWCADRYFASDQTPP